MYELNITENMFLNFNKMPYFARTHKSGFLTTRNIFLSVRNVFHMTVEMFFIVQKIFKQYKYI